MKQELIDRIVQAAFPYPSETWKRPKKPTQICLHHTASGPGVAGDIAWWVRDGQPVSTPLIVGRDGIATQVYSSTLWAFTLGLDHDRRKIVEAATIGLEIDSWGYLVKVGDKFYSYTGAEIPFEEVCALDIPWRGHQYFHKYTIEQIETTRLLLEFWGETYGIDLTYKGDDVVFALNEDARQAKGSGVYGHASFRLDKTDVHPQPDLIAMLKSFNHC
jgi:hypothetical protein